MKYIAVMNNCSSVFLSLARALDTSWSQNRPAYHTCEIHLKHIFGNGLDFANYDQGKDGGHCNEIQPQSKRICIKQLLKYR